MGRARIRHPREAAALGRGTGNAAGRSRRWRGPAVGARAFPAGHGLTERPSASASARQRSDTTQARSGRSPGRSQGAFLPVAVHLLALTSSARSFRIRRHRSRKYSNLTARAMRRRTAAHQHGPAPKMSRNFCHSQQRLKFPQVFLVFYRNVFASIKYRPLILRMAIFFRLSALQTVGPLASV